MNPIPLTSSGFNPYEAPKADYGVDPKDLIPNLRLPLDQCSRLMFGKDPQSTDTNKIPLILTNKFASKRDLDITIDPLKSEVRIRDKDSKMGHILRLTGTDQTIIISDSQETEGSRLPGKATGIFVQLSLKNNTQADIQITKKKTLVFSQPWTLQFGFINTNEFLVNDGQKIKFIRKGEQDPRKIEHEEILIAHNALPHAVSEQAPPGLARRALTTLN